MHQHPLLVFKSHIGGKNSDVTVYADRIEWDQAGGISAGKLAGGVMTAGTSLLVTGVRKGHRGSEVIPIKAVSSVTTSRDGLRFTLVRVICSGNTIDFRVPHADAPGIKDLVMSLVLGTHPALQPGALPPPSAPAPPPPASTVVYPPAPPPPLPSATTVPPNTVAHLPPPPTGALPPPPAPAPPPPASTVVYPPAPPPPSGAEHPPSSSGPPAAYVADELKKLVELRDLGALTDDEFAAQKAKLLGW
jgi:hypothetical protein